MENTNIIKNPYTAGRPVSDENFFGRQDILRSVQEALVSSRQRLVVLHGQRRIGKTSILNQLRKLLQRQGYHAVQFALDQRYAGHDLSEILLGLSEAIVNSLTPSHDIGELDVLRHSIDLFEGSFLPGISQSLSNELLILIDEFDLPGEEKLIATREFVSLLQRLVTKDDPNVNFVLVAGSNLASLPGYIQALFRYGTTVRVSFLPVKEAKQLITQPAKGLLEYTPQAVDDILALTNGHPYCTQLVCSEAFNLCKTSKIVHSNQVREASKSALSLGHGGINWIWSELTLPEQIYLSAVAHCTEGDKTTVEDDQVHQALKEYGIRLLGADLPTASSDLVSREFLTRHGPTTYSFTVDLLRQWVQQEYPLERAQTIIEVSHPYARDQFDLGHKAHRSGNLEEAIEHYWAVVKANPNHFRAQLSLAQALYENENWEQAVIEFDKAYHLDESNARAGLVEALFGLGQAYEQEKSLGQARSQYKRVLEISPEESRAKSRLERMDEELGGLRGLFCRLIGRR